MPEPSLGELSNLHSEESLGTGDVGAVTNSGSDLVHLLNQTAQFQANQSREKYNTFLENLNGIYKDAENIASLDVATEDRDALTKQKNEILSMVYKNPKDFFANVGGAQGQELHKKLAQWRMDATESKQNKLFDAAHREYLGKNPELNTPENKSNVDNYLKVPLGRRKSFTLQLPGLYDPIALGTELNAAVKQDYAKPGVTPDGKFTFTEKGTKYDPEKYRKLAESAYYLPDSRGQQLRSTLQGRFESLPKDIQSKYKDSQDPVKDWYLDLQDQYRKPDQVQKDDLKANPFALKDEKSRNRFALQDLKDRNTEGREIRVAQIKEQLKDSPKPEQTKFLLNLAADVIGNTTSDLMVDTGKGNYQKEKVINASPVILKMFSKPVSTTIKDATGKKTVSEKVLEPDVITKTPDGSVRTIFYKKNKKGETVKGEGGHPLIETSEVAPLKEVMSILGKDYMGKKSLPGAVNLAGDVLSQYGGDINKYIAANKQQAKAEEKTSSTSNELPVKEGKIDPSKLSKGKSYQYNGKAYKWDGKKLIPE